MTMAPNDPSERPAPLPDDVMILLPVRGTVIFPGSLTPLSVGRERSLAAVEETTRSDRTIGIVMQKDPAADDPQFADLHRVGTEAKFLRSLQSPDGTRHVIVEGLGRFQLRDEVANGPFLAARVDRVAPAAPLITTEVEAKLHNLKARAVEIMQLAPAVPEGVLHSIQSAGTPDRLVDAVIGLLDLPADEKQSLLETFDFAERLPRVEDRLTHQLEVLRMSQELRESAKGSMQKAQREFLLREQLKAIQQELGEGESGELTALRARVAEAELPDEVRAEVEKELHRLESLPSASLETGVIQNYLDWILATPWRKSSPTAIDLARAREVLDEDHHGLEKIKRRILEFLAVRKLKPTGPSPILCFVGPPGVGKTSLGRSIARATAREYARISLGGVHDDAEIRGHRRTYVGAMPGGIIQALRRVGVNNPVIVLDELDKITVSYQGNPSAALLEVLDPEQNHSFRDHYLGLPFDLSDVLFIATANVVDTIPAPLRDRCEMIDLSGYTEEEKLEIARRYLVPRRIEASGLTADDLEITDDALVEVIRHYTREAGCRNLERNIGSLARHAAVKVAEGTPGPLRVGAADVPLILGPHRIEPEAALRTTVPGVATGLSWTPAGGEILFVEAALVPGDGRLILTGQLGDVMRESAQAALSLVKGHAESLGIQKSRFRESDVHIHVPAGAIPKDGPSAGVALYVALVSALTDRVVRGDVAMTGEISLRGVVLPVGGIKEKLLAAHRAGIRTVLLPRRNLVDVEDVPASAREALRFVPIDHVRDLMRDAFEARRAASTEIEGVMR